MGGRTGLRMRLAALLMAIGMAGIANAQEPPEPAPTEAAPARSVEVGLFVSPPFVMKAADGHDGMAVDLWELVADRLGLASRYRVYPSVRELVAATEAGEVDVAVTNLSITR